MSEEFNIVTPPRYSSFFPLVIFFIGYLTWSLFQTYQLNTTRVALASQEIASQNLVKNSEEAQNKLVAMGQDLVQLSATDPAAAQVVNDFQIRATAPAAGSKTPSPTPVAH